MRAKPLSDFLRAGQGVGELLPQAEKLLALRKAVARLLPPNLRTLAEVANLKGDKLLIQAANSAAAAKLKLYAPGLRDGLARAGYHIAAIKIEVRPAAPDLAKRTRSRTLPEPAAKALQQLEAELSDDSPLRPVISRLATKTR
ncbi:MAG: DciA family protein [Pseudomonadota bacterium]